MSDSDSNELFPIEEVDEDQALIEDFIQDMAKKLRLFIGKSKDTTKGKGRRTQAGAPNQEDLLHIMADKMMDNPSPYDNNMGLFKSELDMLTKDSLLTLKNWVYEAIPKHSRLLSHYLPVIEQEEVERKSRRQGVKSLPGLRQFGKNAPPDQEGNGMSGGIYCTKCRKKTDTINKHEKLTKNNRKMKCGQCAICGTNKSKFMKGGMIPRPPGTPPKRYRLPPPAPKKKAPPKGGPPKGPPKMAPKNLFGGKYFK